MTHELKFRYVYGIPGKQETYFFRYFTIEEIELGIANDTKIPKHFRRYTPYQIISRDQFTGLKDKNGKEIYENDRIKGKDREGDILEHVVKFKFGGFEPFTHYIEDCRVDETNCEIIGNIYGISTKNDNPNPNEDT